MFLTLAWFASLIIYFLQVLSGGDAMRSILALSTLIIFCAAADAATLRHSRSIQHRARLEHGVTAPDVRRGNSVPEGYAAPKSYAVPGWTDGETQKWLDDATREVGVGG
jgi:hypothetical protein